jgi:Secretion system C-terminal sorting domain
MRKRNLIVFYALIVMLSTVASGICEDVLIWDTDPIPGSAAIVQGHIETCGYTCLYVTELPESINGIYDFVFGFHGMGNVFTMEEEEITSLISYMDNGGNVYLEGGDLWYYSNLNLLKPYFGVEMANDGLMDLANLNGVDGTFTEGMQYQYGGENVFVDRMTATVGAQLIFTNPDIDDYVCGLIFDGSSVGMGDFRTATLTFELGGLTDGDNTCVQFVDSLMTWMGGTGGGAEYGSIGGTVYDAEIGGTPMADVDIHFGDIVQTTGAAGTFLFEEVLTVTTYELRFVEPGFYTEIVQDIAVTANTVTQVDVAMVYPEMSVSSTSDIEVVVDVSVTGDSTGIASVDLSSLGTGPLNWSTSLLELLDPLSSASSHHPQQLDDIWDPLFSFDVTGPDPMAMYHGVALTDQGFYAIHTYLKTIDHFDIEGNLIDQIPLATELVPEGVWGIFDIAWDGTYLYGGNSVGDVFQFSPDMTEVVNLGNVGIWVDACAYDWDLNYLYVNSDGDGFKKMNLANGNIEILEMPTSISSITGMSYMPVDEDGYTIYMISQSQGKMFRYNPTTDEYDTEGVLLYGEGIPLTYSPRGMSVSNDYSSDRWDVAILHRTNRAFVDVFEGLPVPASWIYVADDSRQGVLEAGETTILTVNVDVSSVNLGYAPDFDGDEIGGSEFTVSANLLEDIGPITIVVTFDNGVSSADETMANLPMEYALHQNYPNPFNPTTEIKFDLVETQHVALTVYDVLGRQVAELINRNMSAGFYSVCFDGSHLPSGVYFTRMSSGRFNKTNKMMLLK